MGAEVETSPTSYGFLTHILGWWNQNGRTFPWRETNDPFKVLVAEILLQRSRSGSVAKVYLDVFKRWPDAQEIAEADISEIEDLISPLGLKSRATRVKAVAMGWTQLKTLPSSSKELQELPGVGPYTGNATAVAMSWESDPCVDSVSVRVLRRYLGEQDNGHTDEQVALMAYSQVPNHRWKELNWAILDLAAALCMPRIPRCEECPLTEGCKWRKDQ